jgi:hydrogenase/urease accessory protein HupE
LNRRTPAATGPNRRTIWLISLAVAWVAVGADLLAIAVHAPQYVTFLALGVAAFGIAGVVFASRRTWFAAMIVAVGIAFLARGIVGAF